MKNISDIAKIAGVSKSTVSRYLNNGSVSLKTKQSWIKSFKKMITNQISLPKVCERIEPI